MNGRKDEKEEKMEERKGGTGEGKEGGSAGREMKDTWAEESVWLWEDWKHSLKKIWDTIHRLVKVLKKKAHSEHLSHAIETQRHGISLSRGCGYLALCPQNLVPGHILVHTLCGINVIKVANDSD